MSDRIKRKMMSQGQLNDEVLDNGRSMEGVTDAAGSVCHVQLSNQSHSKIGPAWNCEDEPKLISGLLMNRLVGTGAFATVYMGRWNHELVAVKVRDSLAHRW